MSILPGDKGCDVGVRICSVAQRVLSLHLEPSSNRVSHLACVRFQPLEHGSQKAVLALLSPRSLSILIPILAVLGPLPKGKCPRQPRHDGPRDRTCCWSLYCWLRSRSYDMWRRTRLMTHHIYIGDLDLEVLSVATPPYISPHTEGLDCNLSLTEFAGAELGTAQYSLAMHADGSHWYCGNVIMFLFLFFEAWLSEDLREQ